MTQTRYSRTAMLLHWLIAAALAFQFGLGEQFEHLPRGQALFDVAQFHKSIGITILLLSLIRLGVRFARPRPAPLGDQDWAERLASITHWGLYAFMIAAPLTGWLATSSSRFNIPTYLFGAIPWPDFPFVTGMEATAKHSVHEFAEAAHGIIAKLGLALFLLHVIGALRHQWLLKEALVERMLPLSRPLPRVAGAALILALAGAFFALLLFGQTPGLAPSSGVAPPAPGIKPLEPQGGAQMAPAEQNALPEAEKPKDKEELDKSEPGEGDELPPTDEEKAEAEKIGSATSDAIPAGQAPAWSIAPGGRLGFATAWTGSAIAGSFTRWSAAIAFNPDALAKSSIKVTIDLASASSGDGQRDDMLKGSDFFNIAANPRATWTSRSISNMGGNRYRADGTLSLRGISQSVPLDFTLDLKGKEARAAGSASISRTAFGVGQGEYAKTEEIPDVVKISFSFRAKRG